jgi:glycosyltransferase involved in cell wall biosynthesis
MAEDSLRILQVNTSDTGGGAQNIAWNLFQTYRRRGHRSWLAVGDKHSTDPGVVPITNGALTRAEAGAFVAAETPSPPRFQRRHPRRWGHTVIRSLGHLVEVFQDSYGLEDFRYAETWNLLDLVRPPPQVLHCHNLHGGYFDLRALPPLSQRLPVVLTLHDAWLLSGHCAHSFDCERWRIGCGHCPDLNIYPAIRRDATAYNWRRKQRLYQASRLHVATPSQWLMSKVEHSMLGAVCREARVIPNGVDLTIFRPADRQAVRASLHVPADATVILFAANGIRQNAWKDYHTLRTAVAIAAERMQGGNLRFIALGEAAPPEQLGEARIEFVPFETRPHVVARYYQAADLYIHAARAETFPSAILEALACGTPVIATEVGGIPEQIHALDGLSCRTAGAPRYTGTDATGVLVARGDVHGMASSIEQLLQNQALHRRLGQNARRDAEQRFDLARQVDAYLGWYRELLQTHPQPTDAGLAETSTAASSRP